MNFIALGFAVQNALHNLWLHVAALGVLLQGHQWMCCSGGL